MIWLSLALNYAGLAAFAATMDVHRSKLFRQTPSPRRCAALRIGGGALQLLALIVAILSAGPGIGVIEWIAGWAACGFALTLLLTLKPRWSPWPAVLLLLVTLVG